MTFGDAGLAYLGLSAGVFLGTCWRFRRTQRQRLEVLYEERWGHIATMTPPELEAYSTSEQHLSLIARIEQAQRRWPVVPLVLMPLLWLTVGYWGLQGVWWGGVTLWQISTAPNPMPAASVVGATTPTGLPVPLEIQLSHLLSNVMMPMMLLATLLTGVSFILRGGRW